MFPHITKEVAGIILSGISGAINNVFGLIVGNRANIENTSISSDPELQKILGQLSYSLPLDDQNKPIVEHDENGQEKVIFGDLVGGETVDSRLIARESFKKQVIDLISKLAISTATSNDLAKLLNSGDYATLLSNFESILKKAGLPAESQKEFILEVRGALIGTRNLIELFQGGLAQQLVTSLQSQISTPSSAPSSDQSSIAPPPPPPPMPSGTTLFERLRRAGAVALPGMDAIFEQIRERATLRKTSASDIRVPELSPEEIEKRKFVSELKAAVSGEGRKKVLKTSINPDQEREKRKLERERAEQNAIDARISMYSQTNLKRTKSEEPPIGSETPPKDERQVQSDPSSPRLHD